MMVSAVRDRLLRQHRAGKLPIQLNAISARHLGEWRLGMSVLALSCCGLSLMGDLRSPSYNQVWSPKAMISEGLSG
jgi:hypothetical protein